MANANGDDFYIPHNTVNKEIQILEKYLPEQLTEEEILSLVKEAIENTGAASMKDMGKVMGALKEKTTGKADGKVVSDMVKQELAKLQEESFEKYCYKR